MELAKVTSKGQVTIPLEIQRKLGIKYGDKVYFMEEDGRVYLLNSSVNALGEVQKSFAGEAKKAGLANEEDVVNMIKELSRESLAK